MSMCCGYPVEFASIHAACVRCWGLLMCWPVDTVLYNFNHFSIAINAPEQYGVYALFDGSKKVLLIDSGEVQRDLLRLAEGTDAELCAASPVFFSFVLASMAECERVKRQLMNPASFPAETPQPPQIEVRTADLVQ